MPDNAHRDEALNRRLDQITGELSDMRNSMDKIAEALTRLALLEERHSVIVSTTRQIEERQVRFDDRLDKLEKEQIRYDATASTASKAFKVVWAVVGGGIIYIGGEIIKAFSK